MNVNRKQTMSMMADKNPVGKNMIEDYCSAFQETTTKERELL